MMSRSNPFPVRHMLSKPETEITSSKSSVKLRHQSNSADLLEAEAKKCSQARCYLRQVADNNGRQTGSTI